MKHAGVQSLLQANRSLHAAEKLILSARAKVEEAKKSATGDAEHVRLYYIGLHITHCANETIQEAHNLRLLIPPEDE